MRAVSELDVTISDHIPPEDLACVTCRSRPCAQGCRQCDACMDQANRLWQAALHARRERVRAAEVLRKAERIELDALTAFNRANSTAPQRAL